MKKSIIIALSIFMVLCLAACGAQLTKENKRITAEIIELEFEPGRFSDFDAVAAILKTEDGEEVRLDFDNIDRTMTAIGGVIAIEVSDGEKFIADYSEYTVTFTLENGNQVLFQLGKSVDIIMHDEIWYLYDSE